MGHEVRRVPKNWQHPTRSDGRGFKPLFEGPFAARAAEWDAGKAKWDRGEFPDYADEDSKKLSYEEWNGRRPNPEDYMPDWPEKERTHFMMYESTSEGTPISPAFETPEELARWLVDNETNAFAGQTASYESWLRVARGGYAPSAIRVGGGPIVSGVEGLTKQGR